MENKKTKKFFSARPGVTLLELMIVIGIMSIMMAATLVFMGSSRDQKALEGAAREVAASIREAQNYALAGKAIGSGNILPCEFVWRTWNQTSYRIRLRQLCGNATGDDILYSLPSGVIFKNEDADTNINYALFIFSVPFGNVNISSSNGSVATTGANSTYFTLKKGAYCANITVSSSGNVTEGAVYTSGC
jgi:prepilin-type N-terminal cleavage/methylation domain-containing protein